MASLKTVFKEKSSGPYGLALKAKVVSVGTPFSYKGKDGLEKSGLVGAISDGEIVVKTVCYDSTKFPKFKVGNTLVLREVIRKTEGTLKTVIVTRMSKVLMTADIDVPERCYSEGDVIVTPPPAEELPIVAALSSPKKKLMSISGKITEEGESKLVKTQYGEEVMLKSVTVEDTTGKAKVTLWRETAKSPVRPGDHVKITELVINEWQNSTTLQTTGKSEVVKREAPLQERKVEVEAIGVDNDKAELFLSTGESIHVPTIMLQEALGVQTADEVEMAATSGKVKLSLTCQGSDTVSIEKE